MMTLEQFAFIHCIRESYWILFGQRPLEKDFAMAYARGDDLEVARLVGLLIIAMDLAGAACVHAEKRWLELFDPTVPLAS